MKKLLALLLALVMALSLVACGGGNDSGANVYKLGNCQLELKGAKIAPDDNGAASVILRLGFTNNGDSGYTYGYSMSEKAEQGGEFMFIASLSSVSEEHYYVEAQPGETVDILTGFNLNVADYEGNLNYTDKVKITITDGDSGKSAEITIDPADTPFADSALDVMSGSSVADSGNGGDAVGASTDGFAYFDFRSFTDEAELMKEYEYCKKTYTNEQQEVSANYGGIFPVRLPVSGEMLYMAAAEGVEIPQGAEYFPAMTTAWELRDGKVSYDTGAEGEIMGEAIDPFEELTFTEDGCILYNYGMFIYERM